MSKEKSKTKPKSTKPLTQNGKGDSPRNNYSSLFKNNYDKINWKKKKA